ncbi:MAG: glucose-6-phosphate 1-dehydrogenase [Candidatus Tokpelaia sp. JSC161]|jgi:glucose-6-phosphate 1-dehydrogenase|nr:MAG: glucose-6-phosphate 1-dehydrogenase [Candidatus Tokpelaia sp. JSC161]
MVSKIIPVPSFDCIVFGGIGDLAERKLIPALYHRQCIGQFTEPSRIIGLSRSSVTENEYRNFVYKSIETHVKDEDIDSLEIEEFLERFSYISLDVTKELGWNQLKERLECSQAGVRAFYLAVSPALFSDIAVRLGETGLITPDTRIIVEKPIGKDLDTACALNNRLGDVFSESQIFRIDHYLGKETVQNLMALRFANALYEPLWNSNHIDHVQITVSESVGLEGRIGYYDHAGALRDMVQNHMLQLLCLVAMEPPSLLDANAVRDEKLKVLRSLTPININNVGKCTVRGQYLAGASSRGLVKSYQEDLGELGKGQSDTETFVALKINIENWRWNNTPFYLRTGKRMASRVSEVTVTFRPIPHSIFTNDAGEVIANRLVIRLQPNEGVKQWLMIKDPGPGGMRLRHIPLDMSFADAFSGRNAGAYERLLMDVMRGNQTLFMRRDEVEAAWKWIVPILDGWEQTGQPVHGYNAGTWGPSRAIAMIERDGRTWNDTL